jgi:hypothetical protein
MTNKRRWSMLIVGPGHGLACPPGEEFRGSPAYYERILVEESVEGDWISVKDQPPEIGQCVRLYSGSVVQFINPVYEPRHPPPILAFSWTAGRGPCCKGR